MRKHLEECETYGDFMRYARECRGLSQKQLAEKAGIHQPRLTVYESSKQAPGLLHLIRLADALHISIDEYIGRKL